MNEIKTKRNFRLPSGNYSNVHASRGLSNPEKLGDYQNVLKHYTKELARLKSDPSSFKVHIEHAKNMIKDMQKKISQQGIRYMGNALKEAYNDTITDPKEHHKIDEVTKFLNAELRKLFPAKNWSVLVAPSNIIRPNSMLVVNVFSVPEGSTSLQKMNAKAGIKLLAHLTDSRGNFIDLPKISFEVQQQSPTKYTKRPPFYKETLNITTLRKTTGNTLMDAARKLVPALKKWSAEIDDYPELLESEESLSEAIPKSTTYGMYNRKTGEILAKGSAAGMRAKVNKMPGKAKAYGIVNSPSKKVGDIFRSAYDASMDEAGYVIGSYSDDYFPFDENTSGGKLDKLVRKSLANKVPVFAHIGGVRSGYVRSEDAVKGFLVIGSGRNKNYITFDDQKQKATMDANRVYIQPRSNWTASREIDLNENTSTASIPTGPESVGVKPDATFGKHAVFDCDNETFCQCLKGKQKHQRWSSYLGKDNDLYSKAGSWMQQNYKNKNFIMRNKTTGEMAYARGVAENVMDESFETLQESAGGTFEIMDNGQPIRRKFASFEEAMKWGKMLGARSLIKVSNYGMPIGNQIWNPQTGKSKTRNMSNKTTGKVAENVMDEDYASMSTANKNKIAEVARLVTKLSGITVKADDEPERIIDQAFKELRKGQWTLEQWRNIRAMAQLSLKLGLKLPSLKNMIGVTEEITNPYKGKSAAAHAAELKYLAIADRKYKKERDKKEKLANKENK